MFLLALTASAGADFIIRQARIGQGDLWVSGEVNEPNATITLDDSFSEKTDSEGRFEFRLGYHPATCTVLLKAAQQSRPVVVENCGQRGPAGPPGPPGAGGPTPVASADPEPGTPACGPRAALYTGDKGLTVLVTRKGKLLYVNPLRPLTKEEVLVLEVATGGKLATAYGSDPANLLRGGSPQDLEKILGERIAWEPPGSELPDTMQIVSEAAEVLARLRFKECRDAPKPQEPARPKPAPKSPATANAGSEPDETRPARAQQDKPAPKTSARKPQTASDGSQERKATAARPRPGARASAPAAPPPAQEANDDADPE